MKKVIHHIRRQPEETRRHILHAVMVFFAGILIVLWVYSLGSDFNNSEDSLTESKNELSPFSTIKGNVVGGYENILRPNPSAQ